MHRTGDGRSGHATVLIVDDHELVAEALHRVLQAEPDLQVVAHELTVAGAIDAARRWRPDVILMDFQLPDGRGTDATMVIKSELPETEIVMLTGMAEGGVLAAALEAGCSGFAAKGGNLRELANTIRGVLAGEVRVPQQLIDQLAKLLRPRPAAIGADLTPRELEVLALLAQGRSTNAIVEHLVLSVHTVRNHIRNILMKLNAQSRLEAVAIATRHGLLER
jgi:DNA-binding NarL/FixJ family response regulator